MRGTFYSIIVRYKKSCPCARHDGVSDRWGTSPYILNPTRDGGKWPASRPNRFNPGERDRGTDYKDCTVGTRAGLGAFGERKNLLSLLGVEERFLC